jgi:hypothetical protein
MAAKNITAFSFASPAATGAISGTDIKLTVPVATDVTALIATFTHTGASVAVGGVAQVSGVTANDFTDAVTYTVTAADASTQDYTVTVTVSQVTVAQLAQLRRMVNEPTTTTYSDETLRAYIEACPSTDENGEAPRVASTTTPGEMMVNPDWTATYDLHAAAAMIWEEKASTDAPNYDFSADGGNYSRSQAYEQAMKMVRFHLSRRSPKTITLVPDLARERTYETNNS